MTEPASGPRALRSVETWNVRLFSSTTVSGQSAAISASFDTTTPPCSASTTRRSNAFGVTLTVTPSRCNCLRDRSRTNGPNARRRVSRGKALISQKNSEILRPPSRLHSPAGPIVPLFRFPVVQPSSSRLESPLDSCIAGQLDSSKAQKGKPMNKKVILASALLVLAALPARSQGPPFVAGLQLPSKVSFTRHGNLVVAESGTPANNTGRVSLVDRAKAVRRTLVDGLPSGISRESEPGSPSGPSGVAVQDRTVWVTIGAGDVVLPGPAPGTQQANPSPASPILASLLSLRSSAPLDVTAGGFALVPADHQTLKSGQSVTLKNQAGEELVVRLVADFPDFTAEPRPDFPANVRAGNPFGVAALGQTVYVVDASQNLVRRVDANTGETSTLTTIGKVQNPTPVGPPVTDPVPDSIQVRGDDLVVTTLTGFPFPAGKASVLAIDPNGGAVETLVSGFTTAIDVAPLGGGAGDPMLVLEFSTNMLQQAPGRLLLVSAAGRSTTIAEGLPTPTSMAVDRTTGEVFVSHIFPGFITRIDASAPLPAEPPSAIVPVVASAAGAYGAQYATEMQVSNPYPFAIAGRIVVRPAGSSVTYSLGAFETKAVTGLIESGAGSADILAGVGTAPVTVTTIVDRTSMSALPIPAVDPADAIAAGARGTLITPSDPSRQRFNVGFRALGTGANVEVRLYDSAGTLVKSVARAFAPNQFQQFTFAELLGVALAANQAVTVEVPGGSAIVYGSAVDNATGAMSLQLARAVMD